MKKTAMTGLDINVAKPAQESLKKAITASSSQCALIAYISALTIAEIKTFQNSIMKKYLEKIQKK